MISILTQLPAVFGVPSGLHNETLKAGWLLEFHTWLATTTLRAGLPRVRTSP